MRWAVCSAWAVRGTSGSPALAPGMSLVKLHPSAAPGGLAKGLLSVSPALEPSSFHILLHVLWQGKLCVTGQPFLRDPGLLPRKIMDFVYAKEANTNTSFSISFSR